MERTCKKCGEAKRIEEFNIDKRRKFGVTSICKICYSEYRKKFQSYKKCYGNYKDLSKERYLNKKNKNPGLNAIERKTWRMKNPEKEKAIASKNRIKTTAKMPDSYISVCVNIPLSILKKHPDFIESYREQIKVKRLLKSIKNENTKTS